MAQISGDALECDFQLDTNTASEPIASDTASKRAQKRREKRKSKKRPCLTEADRYVPVTDAQALEAYLYQRMMLDYRSATELERVDAEKKKLKLDFIQCVQYERTLDHFSGFVKKVCPKVQKGAQECGRPRCVIVAASGIRSMELIRSLKPLRVGCAKLFAKHFKLEEQVEFLQNTKCHVAVGTPHRLMKLQETVDWMSSVKCIIVDATFKDQKQRTLFDIPECRKDFFEFTSSIQRFLNNGVHIHFF